MRIVTALAIILFAITGTAAIAAGVTVVVDGRPLYLNPGPIERAGRVFVPLRGIFERLGASVVYENREINSTKGDTSVSLRIGSREATVNGQPQIVDVAPFIVGATTYVPLRFIAQSLGATVDYNGAARRVRNQSAAVESAGRSAAESIRLAEHGQGAIDHHAARVARGVRRGIRRREAWGRGLRLRRMISRQRCARACGQRDDERGGENCPDTAHRSGPIR